jgi:hypothetical protein
MAKQLETVTLASEVGSADTIYIESNAKTRRVSTHTMAAAMGEVLNADTMAAAQDAQEKAQAAYDMAALIKDSTDVLIYKSRGCCIAQIDDNNSSPDFAAVYGDKSILTGDKVWLVDMSQNEGRAVKKELCRYNLLRYADGTFAPTVGITENQRSQCDVALYLDAKAQTKYCDAGGYDAEAFYNDYGMDTPLYDADGNEVRILRPWETTRTDLSIFIGEEDTQYLLETASDSNGKRYRGVSKEPMTWEGVPFEQYKLAPTGLAMSSPTSIDGNKLRCFFFVHDTDTLIDANSRGVKGQNDYCSIFVEPGRAYPRNNDLHAINNQSMAWAMNADTTKPYPFAEGGYHAYNVFITKLELLHGTRYLAKSTRYGSGISSNDACSTEATYLANGGMRYRKQGDSDWKYCRWDSSPSQIKGASYASSFTNQLAPKEQCMESQMAYSYARERGIEAGKSFTFYGNTYSWAAVGELSEASADRMDVRVYKTKAITFTAPDTDGNTQTWEMQYCLRMSLFSGLTASGDVYRYRQGGFEQVIEMTHRISDTANGGNYNFPIKTYLEVDQTKWIKESTTSKTDLGTFGFEQQYKLMGEVVTVTAGYVKVRPPYQIFSAKLGASLAACESSYLYATNYYDGTLNSRARIGARFGFNADYSFCAPRSVHCTTWVLLCGRAFVGSLQVLF